MKQILYDDTGSSNSFKMAFLEIYKGQTPYLNSLGKSLS